MPIVRHGAARSTTYRVLSAAGRLDRWKRGPSKKGTGFVQPLAPHEHWHVDIAYLNVAGTFYYLSGAMGNGLGGCWLFRQVRDVMPTRWSSCTDAPTPPSAGPRARSTVLPEQADSLVDGARPTAGRGRLASFK